VKDKPCINSVIWTIQFSFFVFNQYTIVTSCRYFTELVCPFVWLTLHAAYDHPRDHTTVGILCNYPTLYMFVYFKITPKPLVLGVFCLIDINCIFLEVISSSFFWIVLILFFCYSLKWYWIGTTWWGWNWTPKSL
jgi:hypothetical protein